MALRLSTALRNFVMDRGSMKQALENGAMLIYAGSQPTTADDAATGYTLLCTITAASGTRTLEVMSTGSVTLTGGAAGSVDSITVNSIELLTSASVAYNASLTQTATDVAADINDSTYRHGLVASASGAVITISSLPGTGTYWNTKTVAFSGTTITASTANMASGVAAVNGLDWGLSASGVLGKSGTWSGSNAADGTAGWFRIVGSITDPGTSSTDYIRLDGNISTSGANLNLSSTSLSSGVTTTIDTFTLTEPAS